MDETTGAVRGTDAHRAVVDGISRAFVLAEVAAEHGDHERAAEDVVGVLDDLEPELAELRALSQRVPRHHRAAEYLVAASAPAAICLAHYAIGSLQHAPILPHTALVAVVALLFGFTPALVSIATSVFAAAHVISAGSVNHGDGAAVLLVMHVAVSLLIAYAIARPRFRAPRVPRSAPVTSAYTPIP